MCQLPGKVRQIGGEEGKLERGQSMDGWRQSNNIFWVPQRPGLCHFNKTGVSKVMALSNYMLTKRWI